MKIVKYIHVEEGVEYRVTSPYNPEMVQIYKAEAHDGKYKVEEIQDPINTPTLEERNRSDIDYLSMMTGVDLPSPEVPR